MIKVINSSIVLNANEINDIIIKENSVLISVVYDYQNKCYCYYFNNDYNIKHALYTSESLENRNYTGPLLPAVNFYKARELKNYYDQYDGIDLSLEIWKDVKNYEGFYQISNMGRIKSIAHNEKIIKPGKDGTGYWKFNLCRNGSKKVAKVHRLVAEAFIGDIPTCYQVDHINTNINDNRACNLRIVTVVENLNNTNTRRKIRAIWREKNSDLYNKIYDE